MYLEMGYLSLRGSPHAFAGIRPDGKLASPRRSLCYARPYIGGTSLSLSLSLCGSLSLSLASLLTA